MQNQIVIHAAEIIEAPTERERMKKFIAKWEGVLNQVYKAMGDEAVKNQWRVDGSYGGCHYSHNNRMMSSRLELKMEL